MDQGKGNRTKEMIFKGFIIIFSKENEWEKMNRK